MKSVKKMANSNKRKQNSDRVCKKCGKDAYPNYFYCQECHKRISRDSDFDYISSEQSGDENP